MNVFTATAEECPRCGNSKRFVLHIEDNDMWCKCKHCGFDPFTPLQHIYSEDGFTMENCLRAIAVWDKLVKLCD